MAFFSKKLGCILLGLVFFLVSIFALLVVLVVIYAFVVQPNMVAGRSMSPTYPNQAYVLTNKTAYASNGPQRGDIVIFQTPQNIDIDYISRIIGLPGENVTIENNQVAINGQLLTENYLPITSQTVAPQNSYEIPQDSYFVLGDNRQHANDSRFIGAIPRKNIIGRVFACYWNCQEK